MNPIPSISRAPGKRWWLLGCVALMTTLLVGCAAPGLTPVRQGEAVSLRVSRAPSTDEVRIRNLEVGTAASIGGGAGGGVGALWGLSCGPWAPLCIPLGMAAGSLVGATGGAAVGLTGVLGGEKATQLRARLRQMQASHDLEAELREQIASRAHGHWQLASETPDFVLRVQLQTIELTSTRDEQIGLVMRLTASAFRSDASRAAAPTERTLACTPNPASLAVWLDERSDFLDTLFSSCNQQFAAQIVAELARH